MAWGNDPLATPAAAPVSSSSAPTWGQGDQLVHTISNAEAAGRGFEAGGGDLLNTIGGLSSAIFPNPGESLAQSAKDFKPQDGAGAIASQLGAAAQQDAALKPNEATDGFGGKIAMALGRVAPNLAGAVATGGPGGAEMVLPDVIRAVPYVGKAAQAVASAAPTAAAMTTEQTANLPANATPGDIAKDAGLNLALGAIPGAVGGSAIMRALTGAGIGYGGSAASSYLEGKPQDQVSNIVGAITGAALGGSHEAPEPAMDPFLRNYQKSGADQSNGPLTPKALPAPSTDGSPIDPQPPAPAPVTPTPAEQAFRQDPSTALKSLDPATLKQVAEASDVDVHPTDTHTQIADKIVATGPDYLQLAVLPEYLSKLPSGADRSQPSQTPAPQPQAPTSTQEAPGAATMPPGVTVPVDAYGTAYTPEQGAGTFSMALDRAMGVSGRLGAPVTTVDSLGTAVDSGAFTRAIQEAQAERQRNTDLGLTPDIQRAQQVRAAGMPTDEITSQSDNDAPPWWLAGQDAAEQHARMAGISGLNAEVPNAPAPLPATTPVDKSHDIPLGGGVAKDNSRIYLDKDLPSTVTVPKADGSGDAIVNVDKDVPFHEAVEKPALDQGKHYFDAHEENANSAENSYLMDKYGVTRAAVDKALKPSLDAIAEKDPASSDIPADLDRKPYEDGGDTDMLPATSNELAKLNIPEELHPQALDFVSHVNNALSAGVPTETLQSIARGGDDYATKVAQIDQLTQESADAARGPDSQTEKVPRGTSTPAHGEAGEVGQPAPQPSGAEAHSDESGAGGGQVSAGQTGSGTEGTQTPVRGRDAEPAQRERPVEQAPSEGQRVSFSTVRKTLADRGMTPEAIQAMTHEQLRAEQTRMRRRSEPAPEEAKAPEGPAAINKATVAEERAMKGKAALEFDMRRSNPQATKEALDALARDPEYGTKLATEIIDKPRALTQPESFALMLDKQRIKTETDQVNEVLKAAQASGNVAQQTAAIARQRILDAQMDNNQLASTRGLGLAAQTLQSARFGVQDDYSLARVLSDARMKKGQDLSAQERQRLTERVAEVTAREKAVAEREKAIQDGRREPRAPKERKAAQSQFDSLANQLKSIAEKDQLKPGCIV